MQAAAKDYESLQSALPEAGRIFNRPTTQGGHQNLYSSTAMAGNEMWLHKGSSMCDAERIRSAPLALAPSRTCAAGWLIKPSPQDTMHGQGWCCHATARISRACAQRCCTMQPLPRSPQHEHCKPCPL